MALELTTTSRLTPYRDIAAAECARWDKVAYITSVHPRYGDYVGYVCHFPRGYDPRKAGQWIWHF